ncbi:MAG: DUF2066 domain-containing protein [Thiotrichales bacterium]|nr:DUF2066 domain-containing protein [Thiotrichales bacterium]
MRSFILLVTFLSFIGLKPLMAAPNNLNSDDLFTIVESFDPTVSDVDQSIQKPDLDKKIQQGMRDLLVRLTGDSSIVSKEEVQPFVSRPKSWLRTYQFEPRKEDGVTIGQNLVLDFDAQRLLKAFQSAQIQIWPSSERPATMLMGSYLAAGNLINLTPENLGYRPDIDFRSYPKLLALPYVIAEKTEKWVYPVTGGAIPAAMSAEINRMLTDTNQDYLLSFQIEQNIGQPMRLLWRLFGKNGSALGSAQISGSQLQPLMQTMFSRMIAAYSYTYRQNADVLNAALVSFDDLMSAEQLIAIESYLKAQKPKVHQVFLQEIVEDKALFEVVYQGNYNDFLRLVSTVENTILVSEDALIGQVNYRMRGLGVMPETQLIDLSKEFEANVRQEQQGQ